MWFTMTLLVASAAPPAMMEPSEEPGGPTAWQLALSSTVGAGIGGVVGGAVGWVAGYLIVNDAPAEDRDAVFGGAAAITVGAGAGGLLGGALGPVLLFGESALGGPAGGALGGAAGAAAAAFPAASMFREGSDLWGDVVVAPIACVTSPLAGCAGAACGAACGSAIDAGVVWLSAPKKATAEVPPPVAVTPRPGPSPGAATPLPLAPAASVDPSDSSDPAAP
jgi:hypothetical protein